MRLGLMRLVLTTAALAALLLGVIGCDRDVRYERTLAPQAGVALRHHMAWTIRDQRRVAFLRLADLSVRFVDLPQTPTATHFAPDGRGVLVTDRNGATWIATDAPDLAAPVRVTTSGDYRRASFGPAGGRVVLFDDQGGPGATLRNPNQIAVFDLTSGDVTERTLRSYGSAPQAVRVAPAGDDGRQLAWLLAERYLAVIDLAAPEAQEVVAHLVLDDDSRSVTPVQLQFGAVDGALTTFIRTEGSDDVFTLTFPEAAPADVVPRPYLNQLPAASGPIELQVEDTFEGLRVFTCGRQALAVTHPVTGRRTVVPLRSRVDRLLPFRAARNDDLTGDAEGLFALLWSEGSQTVQFADLDLAERRGERAITPLVMSAPVTDIQPLPGRRGAVARLGTVGLALLDFEARTATPLTANGSLQQLVVEPSGDRVFALIAGNGRHSVVTVDVDTGASVATTIPARALAIHYLPDADRVVAEYADWWGRVRVIDAAGEVVDREAFLLQGAL